jgi:VWFA-related protein
MCKSATAGLLLVAYTLLVGRLNAQKEQRPTYKVNVEMVVLTFSVTDGKGKSITGLNSNDIRISEDGVPQQIVAFAEGSEIALRQNQGTFAAGTSAFVLFDTSNHMYRMFPYVYDSIREFVRRLDPADSVAIYTFSRNLSRAAPRTTDHLKAGAGLQNAVAGDDTALFNAILLTLQDAARVPGRRAIVVFSNGRDNMSMIGPDEVIRVAQNERIPVYIISTREESPNSILTSALESVAKWTGGKLYAGQTWQSQSTAFEAVRQDIHSSYTASYYPAANWNNGFRSIKVLFTTPEGKTWHVHARAGYEAHKSGEARGN